MSFYSDFAEHYEAVFPFRKSVGEFLASWVQGGGQRVLDLGCGTGHYAGRLAAAGHRVVGVDLDPAMIVTARRQYPAAEFQVLDLFAVDSLIPGFNLVFCIGNVLAHLPAAHLPEFLQRLHGVMAPGACWLFQVVNWDAILAELERGREPGSERDPGPDSYHRFPDRTLSKSGVLFQREYRDITADSLRFVTRLVEAGREIFTGEVMLYPVKASDYRRLHVEAGFNLACHLSDYQGTGFNPATGAANIMVFRRREGAGRARGSRRSGPGTEP